MLKVFRVYRESQEIEVFVSPSGMKITFNDGKVCQEWKLEGYPQRMIESATHALRPYDGYYDGFNCGGHRSGEFRQADSTGTKAPEWVNLFLHNFSPDWLMSIQMRSSEVEKFIETIHDYWIAD